ESSRIGAVQKMVPARRGTESVYESHTYVSTCTTPEREPAQGQFPESRCAASEQTSGPACSQADSEGRSGISSRPPGFIALVPQRMGGDCGPDTQRARNAFRMPVLPALAPGRGPCPRIS